MWIDMTSTLKFLSSCNPFVLILHVVTVPEQHKKSSRNIFDVHIVSDITCWKKDEKTLLSKWMT